MSKNVSIFLKPNWCVWGLINIIISNNNIDQKIIWNIRNQIAVSWILLVRRKSDHYV